MNTIQQIKRAFARKGPRWMGPIQSRIPYPLRAARIEIAINVFGCWWKPRFYYRPDLAESARAKGQAIWWFEWLKFQITYSRWL